MVHENKVQASQANDTAVAPHWLAHSVHDPLKRPLIKLKLPCNKNVMTPIVTKLPWPLLGSRLKLPLHECTRSENGCLPLAIGVRMWWRPCNILWVPQMAQHRTAGVGMN